ncbi:MAG TPA: hypothetical protein ENI22_00310 [Candidatus Pacearchaeota archaeon]|nr:hypothetical protein [Candidatus Pacearchaeota archaeon]
MIKNRRGELTTKHLVTIMVLIVSFIIVLFLLFRLNLGETTDDEICRNSVMLRGQSKLVSGPIDCRTNYLCVSGGGECEGKSPKLSVNPNSKNEVMKAIADEMSSCWFKFGEGEVNYGGGFISTSVHCGICSIIEFDENIQENFPTITYSEFYEFLQTNKKEATQSYLDYLYGVNSVASLDVQSQFKINISEDNILTGERYSVITGVDNELGLGGVRRDEILKVYPVLTSKTSSKTSCKEFITKA